MNPKYPIKKIAELIEYETKRNTNNHVPYVGLEDILSNSGKFVGTKEPKEVRSTTYSFSPDHVLYGRLRPYLNKVLLPDFEGHCSTEIIPIKTKNNINKKFFFYWITSFPVVEKINKTCTGARMPRANLNAILNLTIPIPPLPEQQRIVDILDQSFTAIDLAIENTEICIQKTNELFLSILMMLFSNLQKNCPVHSLGNLCTIVGGGTPSKSKTEFFEGNIPWATVRDMKNDYITETEFKITETAVNKSATNIIPKTNVVIATRVGLGKVCILQDDTAINQDLKGIIPNNKNLNNKYLFWWFKSNSKFIEENGAGATVKGVKLPFINNLKIAVPSFDEQLQIVEKLDNLHEQTLNLVSAYQKKISLLQELKQSILHKAFQGELS